MVQFAGNLAAPDLDSPAPMAASLLADYASVQHRLAALGLARRTTRLRLLLPAFARLPQPSEPIRCEVTQIEGYDSAIASLSGYTGGHAIRPINRESLQRLIAANRSFSGAIGVRDLLFLHAFVTVLAPDRVVELGTLTGFSASVIAAAGAQQQTTSSGVIVDTNDLNQRCLTDNTKPVGFEIPHLVPELVERIRVHPGKDARHLGDIVAKGELPLVFIDADHQHPRPTLDLLRVAPFIRSGGWVIVHDVELSRVMAEMRAAGVQPDYKPSYGAQWLFEAWPFAKISGGNIGALQLPSDLRELVPLALALLRIPSELGAFPRSDRRRRSWRKRAA